jgi:hypothetical protein
MAFGIIEKAEGQGNRYNKGTINDRIQIKTKQGNE